ncbi:hypothetical protein [Corynebacterium hiratae]|uniref:Secreted protein n=1 Tax=Corynebacterium hiratae TaxID=3139423 RepID=A0A553G1N8_9CORY|nr:hypothetical protein [Corynebacterium aurimucosum]TRX63382.1 hypothetical protein FNY97_02960 [Corynebacterium aurimucosum]
MKRIHRTLTAAALAGSLALGGTAVASAQIPAPAEFEFEGYTYQRQADGSYKSTNPLGSTTLTADHAQAVWERMQEQEKEAPAEDPATPVDEDSQDNAPAPANPDPAPPARPRLTTRSTTAAMLLRMTRRSRRLAARSPRPATRIRGPVRTRTSLLLLLLERPIRRAAPSPRPVPPRIPISTPSSWHGWLCRPPSSSVA